MIPLAVLDRSSIWMDSAGGSARGLSHISVELLGDMDKCPAIAFQANGHTSFSSIKIGQIVGFKHVSATTVC